MTIDATQLERPEPLFPEDHDDNIDDFVAPRRRRVLPSATWALLFALVGGGGFLAGVKAQHSSGSTTTSGAALANAFRNGGGRAAGANRAGAGTGAAGRVAAGGRSPL